MTRAPLFIYSMNDVKGPTRARQCHTCPHNKTGDGACVKCAEAGPGPELLHRGKHVSLDAKNVPEPIARPYDNATRDTRGTTDEIHEAARRVIEAFLDISDDDFRIIRRILNAPRTGATDADIARELGISPQLFNYHKHKALARNPIMRTAYLYGLALGN